MVVELGFESEHFPRGVKIVAMVAAVSTSTQNPKVTPDGLSNYQKPRRSPLVPSEADNNNGPPIGTPKYKESAHRNLSTSSLSSVSTTSSSNTSTSYASSSNSLPRSRSPMLTRTTVRSVATPIRTVANPVHNSASVKRSQSVDRSRPRPPLVMEMPTAAKHLTNSSRSLSVSFQGQSVSIPVSKAKSSGSKGTLERRKAIVKPRKIAAEEFVPVRDRTYKIKLSEQHRWPARSKLLNSSFLTRSLDFGSTGSVVRPPVSSLIDENHKVRTEAKLKPQTDNVEVDMKSADTLGNSDCESVSSGSTSGVQNGRAVTRGPRGIVVPARFRQEANNRIKRGPEQVSPVDKNGKLRSVAASKQMTKNEKFLSDFQTRSPQGVPTSRGLMSHPQWGLRPASPNKALMTPSANYPLRGMPSPTRTRNTGSVSNNSCLPSSILSFAVDSRRRNVREKQKEEDAHELRLLYNQHLQWRFVNARAEAALKAQTTTTERNLYNAWLTISKLRHSVNSKRIQLQELQQKVKLYSILKGQWQSLEAWSMIDAEYCKFLSESICALKACISRLPVVTGATADIQEVKDAISSAVDVMREMSSSICSLLSKVKVVSSMVHELANVAATEQALLDECNDLFSSLSALQVKDCSLKIHLIQSKGAVTDSTTEE